MNNFYLHQRVVDGYTGKVGRIIKVYVVDNQLLYSVKFGDYTSEFHSDEIREAK